MYRANFLKGEKFLTMFNLGGGRGGDGVCISFLLPV